MSETKRTTTHRRAGARRRAPMLAGLAALSLVLAACGGAANPPRGPASDAPPEVAHGQELVDQSCTACHGRDYEGVSGLGTSFVDNAFIQDNTDAEMMAFIKEGRPGDAPDNDTGIAMPPYGGNPRLTDDDLADIVAFLRTLQ